MLPQRVKPHVLAHARSDHVTLRRPLKATEGSKGTTTGIPVLPVRERSLKVVSREVRSVSSRPKERVNSPLAPLLP